MQDRGFVPHIDIHEDVEIYAILTEGIEYEKRNRKTDSVMRSANKTNCIQLAFVRILLDVVKRKAGMA
jgi:hypothetical protein